MSIAEPVVKRDERETVIEERASDRARGQRTDAEKSVEPERTGPPKSIWREYFESAVVTVIMALFGMTFVVQAVKVPTGSMQNTILIGDQLLVNKFIFAPGPTLPFLPQREVRRGDIIVFKYPGNEFNRLRDTDPENIPFKTNYVKRVVGLPGETIEVRGTQIFINNELLPEQRATAVNPPNDDDPLTPEVESSAPLKDAATGEVVQPLGGGKYTAYWGKRAGRGANDNFPDDGEPSSFHFAVNNQPFTIPPGSYFVMGDNRDNSADSREWGVVRREYIIGRAMFVYWSYDASAPSSGNRIVDFFSNTRWGRTGTLVR